jgi:NADH-quinone oxidoreductase subunit M
VVLGAIYLLWSYQRMALGPVHEEHKGLADVSVREVAVLAPILALLLVFGVYPRLLTDRIDPTTTAIVQHVDPDHPVDAGPSVLALRSQPSPSPAVQGAP